MTAVRKFTCHSCSHAWEEPYGTGRPLACPACASREIRRMDEDRRRRRQGDCGQQGVI